MEKWELEEEDTWRNMATYVCVSMYVVFPAGVRVGVWHPGTALLMACPHPQHQQAATVHHVLSPQHQLLQRLHQGPHVPGDGGVRLLLRLPLTIKGPSVLPLCAYVHGASGRMDGWGS